jgi:acyl carrier protein
MSPTQTVESVSESTRLAWSVLFGGESLRDVDQELLRSLQEDPGTWGRLILDTWATVTALDGKRAHAGLGIDRTADAPPTAATVTPAAPQEEEAEVHAGRSTTPEESPAAPAPAAPAPAETVAPVAAVARDRAQDEAASSVAAAQPAPRPDSALAPTRKPLAFFDPEEEDESALVRPIATVAEIRTRLVGLIAEISGYPEDIFEDHLDLEVDLGIDSIKQVETLAKLREEYGLTLDEGFLMRDYPTVGKMAGYIVGRLEKET